MAFSSEPLISHSVLLTGRVGTLGKIFRIEKPIWASDNKLIIDPIHSDLFDFLYFRLLDTDLENLNRGSTQPLLTQTDLKQQQLICPTDRLLKVFNDLVAPMFAKAARGIEETLTLTQLRDTLLPKLLSGELTIPDALLQAEEAI